MISGASGNPGTVVLTSWFMTLKTICRCDFFLKVNGRVHTQRDSADEIDCSLSIGAMPFFNFLRTIYFQYNLT